MSSKKLRVQSLYLKKILCYKWPSRQFHGGNAQKMIALCHKQENKGIASCFIVL
jgi:hypothetical protein